MPTSPCMCRGSRAAMQECAATWYTTPDPHLQALLPCQLYAAGDSSSTSVSSYLGLQCSSGYEGRLCSICQPGYGSSGSLLARQWLTCSLNCLLSRSLTHPLSRSLAHSLTHSLLSGQKVCMQLNLDASNTAVSEMLSHSDSAECLCVLCACVPDAGQFQSSKCSSAALSAFDWLLLMGLILCNGVAIWVYLPQEVGSWDTPQGSEYFEVR